ncbi:MAG: hypothetical protein ABI127_03700, partial [Dokdonella sp.]
MHAAPAAGLGIMIDGCRFVDLSVGPAGVCQLDLPFSPSGNARLAVEIVSAGSGSAAFGIEL